MWFIAVLVVLLRYSTIKALFYNILVCLCSIILGNVLDTLLAEAKYVKSSVSYVLPKFYAIIEHIFCLTILSLEEIWANFHSLKKAGGKDTEFISQSRHTYVGSAEVRHFAHMCLLTLQ